MSDLNRVIQAAERVVHLRAQLAAAEAELRRAAGGGRTKAPVARKEEGPPVSQRLRELLADGQPREWAQVVEQLGGAPVRMAARAAMKKLRASKRVRFAGGKYSWAGK